MKTFSVLLAIWVGNSPVTGEFPAQKPVTQSFDVFFDLRLKKLLSKQWWAWWFETPSRPLWCHCNVWQFVASNRWNHSIQMTCFSITNVQFSPARLWSDRNLSTHNDGLWYPVRWLRWSRAWYPNPVVSHTHPYCYCCPYSSFCCTCNLFITNSLCPDPVLSHKHALFGGEMHVNNIRLF